MDSWKYYDIVHRKHIVMNPTSVEKLGAVIDFLPLHGDACVVDIACGKGEFLLRLAEAYDVYGTGVDLSPHCISTARKDQQKRLSSTKLEFIQADGAAIHIDADAYDLASCLGASWIFGGYHGMLHKVGGMAAAAGGWVAVGEPFWLKEPAAEYLTSSGYTRETFGTHAENVTAAEQAGLRLVYSSVSSPDDWDVYEGLQWVAAEQYVEANPEDPDIPELIERVEKQKTRFLKWQRDTLGWAIYLFRRTPK